MPKLQSSLGPSKDWNPKRTSDARSAPSTMDEWCNSNLRAIADDERRTRRIGYALLVLGIITGAVILLLALQPVPPV